MSTKTLFFALLFLFAFAVSIGECHAGRLSAVDGDVENSCCNGRKPCAAYCKEKGCGFALCLSIDRCEKACKCSRCHAG
ncbi:hypothetical protein QR680_016261 [Steinernema hermaphroditum]|uniref:Uncharacterized protein n=1 Tax=Steinernema hermaphroditum TaxID=289476 RepID=A0AA39HAM1_9BILA|nr:hypothetical protein QR680_016261 [Steinernema hermaphroditum]